MTKARPLRGIAAPDFAMTDQGTALASLFRPSFRGVRPAGMDITQNFNGLSLRFVNYEALDVYDQSVLLGALGLAGIERENLHKGCTGVLGGLLWTTLMPKAAAINDQSAMIRTSLYQLLEASGVKQTSGQDKY